MMNIEAHERIDTFVPHLFKEQIVDLGEIRMNYAVTGSSDLPALLLIPAQTDSWWSYEEVMALLGQHSQVYAVDLRGQGRSTWTPGRYTLDIMGNDLVRFIDLVIGRSTLVSGNSSGGVLASWLAAYGNAGQVLGAILEDAPLFASESNPAYGQSIRQGLGPVFQLWNKWLGDQWSIGDWQGMQKALANEVPPWVFRAIIGMSIKRTDFSPSSFEEPSQNMKEYDPEWAKAFYSGRASISCDHAQMLTNVRAPILFTHHYREVDVETGITLGAVSDHQVQQARRLVIQCGQRFDYRSFPEMAHSMHSQDPQLFCEIVTEWCSSIPHV